MSEEKFKLAKLVDTMMSIARQEAFREVRSMLEEMQEYNRGWNDAAANELQVALNGVDRISRAKWPEAWAETGTLEEEGSLERGLAESARGQTEDLGSFEQYSGKIMDKLEEEA